MILAVLFLAVMSFISGGIVKKAYASIAGIQDDADKGIDCFAILDRTLDKDGDGIKWLADRSCDCDDDDPSIGMGDC